MHVRAALRNGLTPEEIGEVLLHTAVYAGVPGGQQRVRAWPRSPARGRGAVTTDAAAAATPHFVQSLERGLAVIRAFEHARRRSYAQRGRRAHRPHARRRARRFLLTLERPRLRRAADGRASR